MRIVESVDQGLDKARFCLTKDQVDLASTDLKRAMGRVRFKDGLYTFDQATLDAAGAFLVNELERLDTTLHMPLASVRWPEDIDLREDVSVADESSSYTNSSFANATGLAGSNISWVGKDSNAIPAIGLDIGKTANPLTLWATQVSWTIPELKSAEQLGRPIDTQQIEGLKLKWNMDVDQMAFIGDTAIGATGMFNHALLTNHSNAVTGTWATATAAQILADVNEMLYSNWAATAWALAPTDVRIAPNRFNTLVTTIVSSAGNISILEFLRRNNLVTNRGEDLDINANKWLLGTNNGGQGQSTDSMFAYRKEQSRVRIPLVPLQRTPIEYAGLRQSATYFGRIGCVELVYPETAARRDNLG